MYETAVPPAGDAHTYTGLQAGDSIHNVFNTLHHPCEGVVGFTVYENQGDNVQTLCYNVRFFEMTKATGTPGIRIGTQH